MAVTVKKKIWYGTFFLFLLVMITGGLGIYYVASMKNEEQNILKANYESLSYCHIMQQQLDKIDEADDKAVSNFENALKKQEANVTEQGEGDATKVLREDFNKLKLGDTTRQNRKEIEAKIQSILA